MAVPTTLAPVAERFVDVVREAAGTPGTIPASPGTTFPMMSFNPSDKPEWLENTAWYGDMAANHGIVQGPLIGGFDAGGPYFGDMIGHAVYNMLGDYTVSGTAASPATVTSAPIAAGATTLTVASGGASYTAGMNLWIEDGGTPALNEVVTVASSTATVITLTGATRFAHLTATPFTNTTAPYTHVFALLNSNTSPGVSGNGAGQPATHTWTDRTGIPATGLAAQYSYTCFHELAFTGEADKWLMWEGKAISNVRTIAGTPLSVPVISGVTPIPSWRSTVKLTPVGGGALAQVDDIGTWAVTLTRDGLKPIFTNRGSQNPYVIPRGKLSGAGQLDFTPAISEEPLLQMLANGQPQVQIFVTNGLSGASLVTLQIDVALGAYENADLQDGDDLFGWKVPFKAASPQVGSTSFNGVTMAGASGGSGPVKITLQNAVASY
jgi:hypothetical protein